MLGVRVLMGLGSQWCLRACFASATLRPPPGPGVSSKRDGRSSYMSCSLNSLKGGLYRNFIGSTIEDIKGDTRSLDYSTYT